MANTFNPKQWLTECVNELTLEEIDALLHAFLGETNVLPFKCGRNKNNGKLILWHEKYKCKLILLDKQKEEELYDLIINIANKLSSSSK